MDLRQRTEVFISVHKGLRRGLWGLAMRLGELDWDDREDVDAAGREFENMLLFLREHAANEDQIQFPFLEQRAPDATRRERDEHRDLEHRLDQLEERWQRLQRKQDRRDAGYEFYLQYNQFLSRYLDHMDREERELTEAFYQHCSDPELEDAFKRIVARTSPQSMSVMLSYMLPAMNPAERLQFMSKAEASATAELFVKVKDLADKVLDPKSKAKLSAGLR
jgi:hemerythrin-like domain-containing protein